MVSLTVLTWNVNGVRARQGELQALLESDRPDIVCLQELKAAPDQLPLWLANLDGYWCCWHGGKGYSGEPSGFRAVPPTTIRHSTSNIASSQQHCQN